MTSSLPLLGNNSFPTQYAATKLQSGSPTCSPTVDLVAVITEAADGKSVYVWRTNGQIVHKISLRHHQLAQAVCWKPDGERALACAASFEPKC